MTIDRLAARRLAVIVSGVALMANPGAVIAQAPEHHLDCAAAYVLWGSMYPHDQAEAQRRMTIVYDVLRTEAGTTDSDLAQVPDTLLNGVVFEKVRTLMQDLLDMGPEDGALALIVEAQNCDLDYGFDFL